VPITIARVGFERQAILAAARRSAGRVDCEFILARSSLMDCHLRRKLIRSNADSTPRPGALPEHRLRPSAGRQGATRAREPGAGGSSEGCGAAPCDGGERVRAVRLRAGATCAAHRRRPNNRTPRRGRRQLRSHAPVRCMSAVGAGSRRVQRIEGEPDIQELRTTILAAWSPRPRCPRPPLAGSGAVPCDRRRVDDQRSSRTCG
jgi:hypothetical protein